MPEPSRAPAAGDPGRIPPPRAGLDDATAELNHLARGGDDAEPMNLPAAHDRVRGFPAPTPATERQRRFQRFLRAEDRSLDSLPVWTW
jgi:hypothetical protein